MSSGAEIQKRTEVLFAALEALAGCLLSKEDSGEPAGNVYSLSIKGGKPGGLISTCA
jgi:hypothetical protein